jgi:hypothetical protein
MDFIMIFACAPRSVEGGLGKKTGKQIGFIDDRTQQTRI